MGGHVPTLPQPSWLMGFVQIMRGVFWGEGGRGKWRTDSATNLGRKAFDNCKLYLASGTGASLPDPTGAHPLYPVGDFGLGPPDP